jgi:hypothetical protein
MAILSATAIFMSPPSFPATAPAKEPEARNASEWLGSIYLGQGRSWPLPE